MAAVRPNAETVAALLDTTWRIAGNEAARTDAIDRKAGALVTFASLLTAFAGALGVRFAATADSLWALVPLVLTLTALLVAVAYAIAALFPREYLTLGLDYLRRFPKWSEILKPPEQVRGETMAGLIEALARERDANDRKIRLVKHAYTWLGGALALLAIEAVTLGVLEIA